MLSWILPVLMILSLSACGFHLRGAYQLPEQMSTTFIQTTNQNSELIRALKRSLKANDVVLVDQVKAATAILKISAENQDRRILSVDSRGRAREYELIYAVTFSVQSDDAEWSLPDQMLTLEREFLFDTEDVLGKGREEATLIKDMQQDMVRLILLRLQAAKQ